MPKQEIFRILVLTVLGVASLILAILVLVGAALLTDNAYTLIGVSLLVLVGDYALTQYIITGGLTSKQGGSIHGGSVLVLLAVFALAVLVPARGEEPADLPGVRYWELPTGSRIAYLKISPLGRAHTEPVIFLHGGPGVADLQGGAATIGRLRQEGYIVYVYDQLGSGRSSRLEDPAGYTIERNAADLEQIRQQIGAEQVILIGHSYGAGVAARYISQHGEHVSKLVVISPGNLQDGLGGEDMQSRLSAGQKLSLYSHLLKPRALVTYALLQVNPRAAHSFAGDSEMDARFEDVYAASEPALYCGDFKPERRLQGLGFYVNQFPQSAQSVQPEDISAQLARYSIPTLVIKGSCDYLSWASAVEYLEAFQAGPAQLAYLSGAGHNTFEQIPRATEANILAFLSGEPLPDPYTGTEVPVDFEKGY